MVSIEELKKGIRGLVYGQEVLMIVMSLICFVTIFLERAVWVLFVFIWLATIYYLIIGYKVRKRWKHEIVNNDFGNDGGELSVVSEVQGKKSRVK